MCVCVCVCVCMCRHWALPVSRKCEGEEGPLGEEYGEEEEEEERERKGVKLQKASDTCCRWP